MIPCFSAATLGSPVQVPSKQRLVCGTRTMVRQITRMKKEGEAGELRWEAGFIILWKERRGCVTLRKWRLRGI